MGETTPATIKPATIKFVNKCSLHDIDGDRFMCSFDDGNCIAVFSRSDEERAWSLLLSKSVVILGFAVVIGFQTKRILDILNHKHPGIKID